MLFKTELSVLKAWSIFPYNILSSLWWINKDKITMLKGIFSFYSPKSSPLDDSDAY